MKKTTITSFVFSDYELKTIILEKIKDGIDAPIFSIDNLKIFKNVDDLWQIVYEVEEHDKRCTEIKIDDEGLAIKNGCINASEVNVREVVCRIINNQSGYESLSVKNLYVEVSDLGLDSLDYVQLIMKFEQEFSIIISDDQAENIKNVMDIVNLIESEIK